MSRGYSHCGFISGVQNKIPIKQYFIETKRVWIAYGGIQYRKTDGFEENGDYSHPRTLDLTSIIKLENPVKYDKKEKKFVVRKAGINHSQIINEKETVHEQGI